jgi:hypothetical protein
MPREIKESQRVIARRRRGDERLLAALASGLTIPEAAKEAGLSPRTAHRRMANPLFRAELDEYRREVVRRASASLETAVGSAVATLEALMADRDPWVRLRAASAILSAAVQLKDIQVLEERLMSLEEQARELPLAAIQ